MTANNPVVTLVMGIVLTAMVYAVFTLGGLRALDDVVKGCHMVGVAHLGGGMYIECKELKND